MKDRVLRDDFLENHILTNIRINENQSIAAFFANKANVQDNSYDKSLWLLHLDGKNTEKPDLKGNVKDFVWENNSLIYFVEKEGTNIFYKYSTDAGISEELFVIPMGVSEFVFARGKMFFTGKSSSIERTQGILEGNEFPFFLEGMGVFSNNRKTLFSFDMAKGKIVKISGADIHVDHFVMNESKDRIALIGFSTDKGIKNESNVYLVDTESERIEIITAKDTLSISDVAFLDEETVIFTGADLKTYGRNENKQFYTIDISSKELRKITEGFDRNCFGKEITTDARFSSSRDFHVYKNQLYFLTIEGSSTYLNRIDKKGILERLNFEKGTIDSFSVLEDGIVFTGLKAHALHEIYLLKDGSEKRVTSFNNRLVENRILAKPEPLASISTDGIEVDGWVIEPIDYDDSKKYPGILCIHGGPKMVYSDVYYHMMQLLAACGYFVFYCNPRGSDGKGNEFADIRGHFASHAFEDILNFTDCVLKKYASIDANRLGVMGGSYGGYMTNYIVGRTNRFKAAVSERGISNLISTFNTSDIGYLYVSNYIGGGNLWNNEEPYIRDSPITYAKNVSTPILFIHGMNDNRCNYTESMQMYNAVRYFGIEAKLCLFEEENHSLEIQGRPLNKIKRFDEIIGWFDGHLGKGEQHADFRVDK